MTQASPAIHNLARQLLVLEAAQQSVADENAIVAVRVIEKFRGRLIKLAGVHGFRSLLSRALTLARREFPLLQEVQIQQDGSLEGFLDNFDEMEEAERAGEVLVAHLLELLIIFIGKSLTLQLMRDAWPGANPGTDLKTEETP